MSPQISSEQSSETSIVVSSQTGSVDVSPHSARSCDTHIDYGDTARLANEPLDPAGVSITESSPLLYPVASPVAEYVPTEMQEPFPVFDSTGFDEWYATQEPLQGIDLGRHRGAGIQALRMRLEQLDGCQIISFVLLSVGACMIGIIGIMDFLRHGYWVPDLMRVLARM